MFEKIKEIRILQLPSGKLPYQDWLHNLKDLQAKAQIRLRIDRLAMGNPGKYRALGDKLYELKLNHGPGYRLYLGHDKESMVILLCGGDKRSQSKDVLKAKKYWNYYRGLK